MKIKNEYKNIYGAVLMFGGAILFSAKAVMVKLAYKYGIEPISLLALRMLFSLPFYIGIALLSSKKQDDRPKTKDWFLLVLLGIVGYYLSRLFDFIGLKYITANLERLILFIYPTLVVVFSAILFRIPIGRKEWIALACTYFGIFIVFYYKDDQLPTDMLIGATLIFLSAVTYAFFLMGSGRLIPKFGTTNFTTYVMIISCIAVLTHNFIFNKTSLFDLPQQVYIISILMAVFSTVIPSFLISEGIANMGSGPASIVASIGPVSTIILSYVFLKEPFGLIQGIGTVFVLLGVGIVSSNKKEVKP